MADNDSGDKTEKPTAKKLRDARKKGDVPKSRELTSTAGLVLWFALGSFAAGYAGVRLAALFDVAFEMIVRGWPRDGFGDAVRDLGLLCAEATILLSALAAIPAAVIGVMADFLQLGPILAFEKVTPKMEHLNPVEGVKRMFTMDNLVELAKSLAKTALLVGIGWLIVRSALPELVLLARSPDLPAQALGGLISALTMKLLGWSAGLFAFVSILDIGYQRYSFTKKMRMSMRDIKQEAKDTEGDPFIKAQRRQTQQEWSQQSAAQAARDASVLLVNPTHLAIAIEYDEEDTPVPCVCAKGEGEVARAMREAAEQAGTPIVRNIALARDLYGRADEGDLVPSDLFEIIAEVILWAREARERVEIERRASHRPTAMSDWKGEGVAAPGEDLTRYGAPR